MILRILNFMVIGALVLAAAYVYRIKFDSTVQAERLAKIRSEVRHERDTIAALRAKWGELDNPARIEALAKRFLPLKPIVATQFDSLDGLPERPPQLVPPGSTDPIGSMIEILAKPPTTTGSIPDAAKAAAATAPAPVPSPAPAAAPVSQAAPGPALPPAVTEADAPAPGDNAGETGGDTGDAAPAVKSGRLDR